MENRNLNAAGLAVLGISAFGAVLRFMLSAYHESSWGSHLRQDESLNNASMLLDTERVNFDTNSTNLAWQGTASKIMYTPILMLGAYVAAPLLAHQIQQRQAEQNLEIEEVDDNYEHVDNDAPAPRM